jgi:hypothetical protein
VRARQEHLGLGLGDLVLKARDEFSQLLRARLVLRREFKEHLGVGHSRLETLLPPDDSLQTAALLQDLLRLLLV